MKCSVCINTYKRPKLLQKLLHSLLSQDLPEQTELEIVVVDNGPKQRGRKIVEDLNNKNELKIKYFVQTEKNISLTRNVAVANTTGDYILFIDDDGYADKDWVKNMLDCAIKYKADGVFGRVIPYFSDETPEWIKHGKFFDRKCEKTGETPRFTRTTNCLINAKLLKSVPGPFDPEYGLTGGGDSHLFSSLYQEGVRYVSCYEGVVYDFVHPERANYKWLLQRSFRTGNTYTRRVLEFSNHSFLLKTKLFFKAILYSLISLILIIMSFFSKKLMVSWTLKLVGNIGHLLAIFRYHYVEYK